MKIVNIKGKISKGKRLIRNNDWRPEQDVNPLLEVCRDKTSNKTPCDDPKQKSSLAPSFCVMVKFAFCVLLLAIFEFFHSRIFLIFRMAKSLMMALFTETFQCFQFSENVAKFYKGCINEYSKLAFPNGSQVFWTGYEEEGQKKDRLSGMMFTNFFSKHFNNIIIKKSSRKKR